MTSEPYVELTHLLDNGLQEAEIQINQGVPSTQGGKVTLGAASNGSAPS